MLREHWEHELLAKHQNAHRGRWEAFWASEQTSVVELVKPKDVMAKMVYAIANSVTSHLVDKVHHWPGVESLTARPDRRRLILCPAGSANPPMPDFWTHHQGPDELGLVPDPSSHPSVPTGLDGAPQRSYS